MADSNRQGGWPARWWGEFHFQNIISMRVGSQVNILRPIRVLELRSKTDPQSRSSDCSGEGPWHRMLTQCNEQQMPWPRDQKRHLQTKALRSMESIRVAPQTASLGWGGGRQSRVKRFSTWGQNVQQGLLRGRVPDARPLVPPCLSRLSSAEAADTPG